MESAIAKPSGDGSGQRTSNAVIQNVGANQMSLNIAPPSAPKSSINQANIERQRQLKSRLKVSWGEGGPKSLQRSDFTSAAGATLIDDSLKFAADSLSIKGYGEIHFADSDILSSNTSRLGSRSKSRSEGDKSAALLPILQDNNYIYSANNSIWSELDPKHSRNYISREPRSQFGGLLTLPNQKLTRSVHRHADSENIGKRKFRSHFDLSKSLMVEGFEGVTNEIVDNSEFCYVERDDDNFYKFGLKSTLPNSILANEYSTISAYGVLRATNRDTEVASYATIQRELDIYGKLLQINLFKNHRIWKSFFMWKTIHLKNRYEERVMDNCLLFYSESLSITKCLLLNAF